LYNLFELKGIANKMIVYATKAKQEGIKFILSLPATLIVMKPLKALIVEDNVFMATVFQDMLKQYASRITVTDIAKTGKEAIS
jgi:hypothetical protein